MTHAVTGRSDGRGRVLSVGRLYCDLVFTGVPRLPTLDTEVFAEGLNLHAGGGAFITAAIFAALGRSSALAAMVPAEPFGKSVLAEIARADVDASLCQPAASGVAPQITVAMATGGDRAFLTHNGGPALPALDAAALRAAGARHLHIGELRTLQEVPGLIDEARAAGMTVSLDCGWDDNLDRRVADLIAAVDVFLPNQEEARRLESLGIAAGAAPLTVVKRGAAGAVAIRGEERKSVPGAKVRVVDTTGAGDAFNGGFLDRWLDGAPLDVCLAEGNACGAAAVQATGGTGGLSELSSKRGDDRVHLRS
ncbi:carbohydrate kinase family protein [Tranquillimonas alkanivorans]|uniref:Sugar or nucleoside kinase, ribokinase family n=1 Tax=Tranquillimonas alkanivorans TaxID=441119 RepID=A0A1I5WKP9_9RHOB|nr:carbohydrate kinase family protein [Tranquillimonas alkanivorans]SFQ19936.1 Sugar or nucleoside kinase, ribokinase family [Tranquillimonas alkanivorans]